MKILTIESKKHGTFKIKLDDEDYYRVINIGRSKKWTAAKKRSGFYFQKQLPGDKKLTELHRFLMGCPKGKVVDHINRDTTDNRKSNLRVCSHADNIRNGKLRTNNTTGHPGVEKNAAGKWTARIKVNYKNLWLGSFSSKKDAIRARKTAEKIYFNTCETN
jgi:hypothetical protein